MSANANFWTKDGVKHHTLPSNVSDYSTTSSYSVGQWVWNADAVNPGLHVCKTQIIYVEGTPHVWNEDEWVSMDSVSRLFSPDNTELANTIKDCGGVQHDTNGYFIETEV